MKLLRISLFLLIVFSLITAICYAQTAKDYYERGVEYGIAGKFEEAQQQFKKALEIDPFFEPAKECLKLVGDALKQRIKTETALHLFKGTAYGNKGMHDEEITEYKRAIEINPNYAKAHCNLGIAYEYNPEGIRYGRGCKLDEAIAEYNKALEINPEYADAHYNLGVVYDKKGMLDEAIAAFRKVIEINPNYADAHNNLGGVYGKKGMHDEAITAFKKVIEINPNYAMAHNNLAIAYYHKGEYSLAIKHCDRAIELGYKVQPKLLELLKPYWEGLEKM